MRESSGRGVWWLQPSILENLNLFISHKYDKITKIGPLPHTRLANKVSPRTPPPEKFPNLRTWYWKNTQYIYGGKICDICINFGGWQTDRLFFWCVQKLGNLMVVYKCTCMYFIFSSISERVLHEVTYFMMELTHFYMS